MSDATMADNLTERQAYLLLTLIQEYIGNAEPVSSKRLSLAAQSQLSSATIRNEMSILEEEGYIRSPHTSSGRVPTEKGYRYFVQNLMNRPDLPLPPIEVIRNQFHDTPRDVESRMQTATIILAHETQAAALVTEPRGWSGYRFKHIELIGVQGRLVLMVLVLTSGHVHQQMLVMNETIPQALLSQASEALNRSVYEQDAAGVREHSRNLSSLAHDIGELAAEALQNMNDPSSRVRYQAGFSDILPGLEDRGAKQALRMLEGQTDLIQILDQLPNKRVGTVHVLIGGEGRWEELSHLSVILGRYGTGEMMGAIGVIGAPRMRYDRAIATVGYVAELVSRFLAEAHGTSADTENGDTVESDEAD